MDEKGWKRQFVGAVLSSPRQARPVAVRAAPGKRLRSGAWEGAWVPSPPGATALSLRPPLPLRVQLPWSGLVAGRCVQLRGPENPSSTAFKSQDPVSVTKDFRGGSCRLASSATPHHHQGPTTAARHPQHSSSTSGTLAARSGQGTVSSNVMVLSARTDFSKSPDLSPYPASLPLIGWNCTPRPKPVIDRKDIHPF